jgi:HEAT repeat protein
MKRSVFAVLAALCMSGIAHAKLPVPTEEQKAAAAAAKDKAAWTDKVSAYQLCKAQDRVVAYYAKTKTDAKPVTPTATTACTDPGPYVAQVAAQAQVGVADSKPVPAAGAVQPGAVPKK